MMFNRIAEYLLVYELKFPQKIFVERLGFSRKSARKYFSGGIADEGRGINQFISRLRKVSESSVSSSTKFISEFLVNDLEYRVGKNKNEAPFVECFKYGYCMSIYDECKTLNIDPTEFLETVPQCYYSMMFIDAVSLPYNCGSYGIDQERFPSLGFPYNILSNPDVEQYFNVISLKDRPDISAAGDEVYRMLKDSFVGLLAAISLDLDRLIDQGSPVGAPFFEDTWEEENIMASYFKWIRNNSGCKTHEEFYSCIARYFPNIEYESVKTNYKRWCKTGKLKNNQLSMLSGIMNNKENGEILFYMQYISILLLQLFKTVLKECGVEYSYDLFKSDLTRWKNLIVEEYPVASWQPFKAAS